MREIGKTFRLRVLLVLVDEDNNIKSLLELNKLCFTREFTMILCWSNEECGRYIETFKLYENKSASSIQEKAESEFIPQLNKVMTNVRSVNKTDVVTLLEVFGSFGGICNATEQQLILCPGLGDKKVRRLYKALHEPFKNKTSNSSSSKIGGKTTDEGNSSNRSVTGGGMADTFGGGILREGNQIHLGTKRKADTISESVSAVDEDAVTNSNSSSRD
jgi:DNA excision repair protein ERCC-1